MIQSAHLPEAILCTGLGCSRLPYCRPTRIRTAHPSSWSVTITDRLSLFEVSTSLSLAIPSSTFTVIDLGTAIQPNSIRRSERFPRTPIQNPTRHDPANPAACADRQPRRHIVDNQHSGYPSYSFDELVVFWFTSSELTILYDDSNSHNGGLE